MSCIAFTTSLFLKVYFILMLCEKFQKFQKGTCYFAIWSWPDRAVVSIWILDSVSLFRYHPAWHKNGNLKQSKDFLCKRILIYFNTQLYFELRVAFVAFWHTGLDPYLFVQLLWHISHWYSNSGQLTTWLKTKKSTTNN